MARNNCSALAADFLLFGRRCDGGGGGCENYEWEITPENEGQRTYYIQHGFGAKFLRCNVYDVDAECEVFPAIQFHGVGMLTVFFAEPPAVGQKFKIVITYHGESDTEEE